MSRPLHHRADSHAVTHPPPRDHEPYYGHGVEPGLTGQLVATRPTVVSLGGLGTVVVTNQLLVRLVDEPHLRLVHGQDYLRYAAAVGRFVPSIGRLKQPSHAIL
jgi:hypothetical protein